MNLIRRKIKKLITDKEFENIAMDAKDKSDSNLIAVKNDGKNLVFCSRYINI